MNTKDPFDIVIPTPISQEWEDSFFKKLAFERSQQHKKNVAVKLIVISFVVVNLFTITYSLKKNLMVADEENYSIVANTLYSSNNY